MKTPNYYLCGKYECIDIIQATLTEEQFIGYLAGNVQKYIWRWQKKGKLKDLEKALYYLQLLIKKVKEQQTNDHGEDKNHY